MSGIWPLLGYNAAADIISAWANNPEGAPMYETLLAYANTQIDKAGHAEQYARRLVLTFEAMRPHLPAACADVLDVGCGLAGISLALALHYTPSPVLRLLDGEAYDRAQEDIRPADYVPYAADCKPWNDARTPARALAERGYVTQALPPDPALTVPADVIVSTRSWGHHYPVETYLKLAVRSLRPGGRLFLDLRLKGGMPLGLPALTERFNLLFLSDLTGRGKCVFAAFKPKD